METPCPYYGRMIRFQSTYYSNDDLAKEATQDTSSLLPAQTFNILMSKFKYFAINRGRRTGVFFTPGRR